MENEVKPLSAADAKLLVTNYGDALCVERGDVTDSLEAIATRKHAVYDTATHVAVSREALQEVVDLVAQAQRHSLTLQLDSVIEQIRAKIEAMVKV